MKAIRVKQFGGPEVLRVETMPDLKPGPGQILVLVKAAGVNPVDTYIRSGMYGGRAIPPYTPGADAGGVVGSVGAGVTGFRPGDKVYTSGSVTGAYAEQALCEEAQVHRLPEKASFAYGAALGVPYATGYRALFQKARAVPGETVLIHGASGGVGVAAVQLARAAGMKVAGTAGSGKGSELAAGAGAHLVLDHRAKDYLDKALEWTAGRGFDVILEMLANVNLAKDLKALAKGGRVVVIGSRGAIEIDPRETMMRDAAILGMSLFNATASDLVSIHAALGAGLENGTLRPVIGRQMPLAEAPQAHEAVMQAGAYGKIVLTP